MLTRRAFAGSTLKISALMLLPVEFRSAAEVSATQELQFTGEAPTEIPSNFIGSGFEVLSVATQGLLCTANHCYVALINGLGPDRLCSSDRCRFLVRT